MRRATQIDGEANGREWPVGQKRKRVQRGSALLIVLVFAAIVAIMLYRALPVAAFEAQRRKEELLVSRGNEYKRGVKLFVRKVGRFPNSIDELESTNRMRFLRHRYMDPLTGKDDWRLVHAGPGGVIIDSKVKSAATDPKNAGALGQGAAFAGFNNSFSGDTAATVENTPAQNVALRQRGPATRNASTASPDPQGFSLPGSDGSNAEPDQTQAVPMVMDPATGQPVSTAQAQVAAANGLGPDGAPAPNAAGTAGNGITSMQDQLHNANPRMPEQAHQNSPFGNTSAFPNQQNSATGNQGKGIGAAGGIAGVASNAPGVGIKSVNDQTKYKLWEFYYDLQKDQNAGAANAAAGVQQKPNAAGAAANGTQPNRSSSPFGFGQTQSPPAAQPQPVPDQEVAEPIEEPQNPPQVQ